MTDLNECFCTIPGIGSRRLKRSSWDHNWLLRKRAITATFY
jgi:hypothetical protein